MVEGKSRGGRPRTSDDESLRLLRNAAQHEQETNRQLAIYNRYLRTFEEAFAEMRAQLVDLHAAREQEAQLVRERLESIEGRLAALIDSAPLRQAFDDLADVAGQSTQLLGQFHTLRDEIKAVRAELRGEPPPPRSLR